jgi:sphingolipid delta-4 desaturase
MPHEEPHLRRRRAILQKYGKEIEEISKVRDWRSAAIVVAIAITQLTIAYHVREYSTWVIALVAVFVGAVLNHSAQVLSHDLTHYTAFHSYTPNRIAAILCNVPTLLPTSMSFGKYHYEHHIGQGLREQDTDLPSVDYLFIMIYL